MNKAEIMTLADGYAIAVAQAPHNPRPLAKKLAEQRIEKARDALVAALEQTEQQAEPDRRDLQAAGTHPAPCARHCEAKAFEIEIRSLKSQLKQQAEPVAWGMAQKDGLILDVICPEEHQSYEGEYTIPLYTTPPQSKPLTCLWSPEDDETMPGTYRSACGELWSFIDGGWKDNRVRYCHGCGGKVIEASSGIQEPKS